MTAESPTIRLERYSERHVEGLTALYNDPAVARQTGVDYSILSGRIDRIKDTPYGQLTLALVGGDLEAAMSQLNAADVHVEVLR